jgi:hypothetical protein
MKTATVRLAVWLITLAIAAIACRQPTGDPQTPPNSPLPKMDQKDEPASSPPPPLLGKDGGASRPRHDGPQVPRSAIASDVR